MGDVGYFRGEGGAVWQMDLPLPAVMQEKVVKGYLVRVNPDGSPYTGPDAEKIERPSRSASKVEWVGYAVRAHGVDPDTAEAMTRQDLIDAYGG